MFYTEFIRVFLLRVLNVPLIEEEWSAKGRSHLVDVLLRVERSRWVTAALFGPVDNNPIMLPTQIRWAASQ